MNKIFKQIYKEHLTFITFSIVISIILSFIIFLYFRFDNINNFTNSYATNAITFISINIGFYIASISTLFSSKYIEKLDEIDIKFEEQWNSKQKIIYTLKNYFLSAIEFSLITLIISFILMFNEIMHEYLVISILSLLTATLTVNIVFIYLLLKVFLNAMLIQAQK